MRINQIISAIAIVFITWLFISCNLNPAEEDIKPIVVNFSDPNFEALIRENLEIPEREITNRDMWTIKGLNGISRNISNITGIEYCTGLNTIYLRDNFITNIEPLSELVLLEYVNLQDNLIVDILPLVNNVGLGLGNDIIIIYNNPLSDESILKYKPQLQFRGIEFYSNATLANPGEINFMDGNFEEVIREHLNNPTGIVLNTDLESLTNIDGQNRNISNIYGIEFCINLDTLDIGMNQISDLIPLFYLRGIYKT
jgi:internalin A